MIQEYLILDNSEKDSIKTYKPTDVKTKLFSASKGACWYIQFSSDGDSEKSAKRLSDVDDYVREYFNVTILKSGCSAYFNKRLYPLVSEFEHKLRKLLYLTSAINKGNNLTANINNLEAQDFGQIFTLLFIDNDFMGKVKNEIKNRNREDFSKDEVIALIENTDENTLWDALLGKDAVPTLRSKFHDVRIYRNDVMHSHLINWKRYKEIQKLYRSINSEIDDVLHDTEVTESQTPSRPSFNETLAGALKAQEQLAALSEALRPSVEQMRQLSQLYTGNPEIQKLQETIRELSSTYTLSPEMQNLQEQLREISRLYQPSPAMETLREQIKSFEAVKLEISPALQGLREITKRLKTPKIEIPPELLNLQKHLSELNVPLEDETTDKPDEENNDANDNAQDDGEERLK